MTTPSLTPFGLHSEHQQVRCTFTSQLLLPLKVLAQIFLIALLLSCQPSALFSSFYKIPSLLSTWKDTFAIRLLCFSEIQFNQHCKTLHSLIMKTLVAVFGLVATSNALIAQRWAPCCFHLSASGAVTGTIGQLNDGQNRQGGPLSPAQYCITDGSITDGNGRGCILTRMPPPHLPAFHRLTHSQLPQRNSNATKALPPPTASP
jgi:hypothetical protein